MCGGRFGLIWLPSHHSGGYYTLVEVEEIPPFYVKRFEYPEKRYIKITNYYFCFALFTNDSVVGVFSCVILKNTFE